MKIYKNILCAIDFSLSSEESLEQAIYLSDAFSTNLTLVHYIEPVIMTDYGYGYGAGCQALEEEQLNAGKKKVKQLLSTYELKGVDTIVEVKRAREGIVELVESLNIDLVVMGRHGHHSIMEHLLGSTTHNVINQVGCNVLITQESQ
jgi:universal stress protein A